MKLVICAVGRQRAGPAKDLAEDYLSRAKKAGRAIGIPQIDLIEVTARETVDPKTLAGREAERLLATVPKDATLVALDECGDALTSDEFAARLARWRDGGATTVAFMVGGADGLAPEVRARADLVLALGRMTWPHMLARVLIAEQLYRAVTILAGHPYHRG